MYLLCFVYLPVMFSVMYVCVVFSVTYPSRFVSRLSRSVGFSPCLNSWMEFVSCPPTFKATCNIGHRNLKYKMYSTQYNC